MALTTRKMIRTLATLTAFVGLAVGGGSLLASVASAEETECPELTQTKYPFLTCDSNAHGGVTLRLAGHATPLECHLRMPDGICAASPEVWRMPSPEIWRLTP